MRVWLVTSGEPLPFDEDKPRLLRVGILAQILQEAGHEVVWWTSRFDHKRKLRRTASTDRVEIAPGYTIHLLDSRGYKKDFDLARIFDHREVARNFEQAAANETKPDIILASLPTLDLAAASSRFGKKYGLPVVIDSRDMWPDLITWRAPKALQGFAKFALSPLYRLAREACRDATALSGHTEAFVDWGLAYAGRERRPLDKSFPFGYPTVVPAAEVLTDADAFWDGLLGPATPDEFLVIFTGTLGSYTNLDAVFDAADALRDEPRVRFVICGKGDRLADHQMRMKDNPNVIFPGWVNQASIYQILRRAKLGLACPTFDPNYVNNIPNKIAEYLSAGLPIALNLPVGIVRDMIESERAGFSFEESGEKLAARVRALLANPVDRNQLARNAKVLFEDRFMADRVYKTMTEYLGEVIQHYKDSR